jgi:hypothetical protein
MALEAEILTKVSDLLDAYSGMLSPSGGSKLLTLDRDAGSDAALSRLREGGAERWRYGMLAGDDDFVLQWSTDGSELNFVDRLRIDGATGSVEIAGLALDGASFNDTTFTGQSLFDAGSAAAPSLAVVGDVDTGLFFPAADAIAGAVGGAEIWRTTAAGLGINTTADRLLHLKATSNSTTNEPFKIQNSAGSARLTVGAYGYNHNLYHVFKLADVEVARFVDGKFGWGTSSPATALHVKASGGTIRLEDTASGVAAAPALQLYSADGLIGFFGYGSSSNNDFDVFTNAGNMDFWTAGLHRLRLTTAGQFLVGTTVAGASLLVVNDDSIQINLSKTPASASDTGTTGQIAWDGSYLYVCTAPDTWTRAALATW